MLVFEDERTHGTKAENLKKKKLNSHVAPILGSDPEPHHLWSFSPGLVSVILVTQSQFIYLFIC